jgi:outer membrane lipoprotein SlyB
MKIAHIKAFPLALALVALAGCEHMKKDQAGTDTMGRSSTTASPSSTQSAGQGASGMQAGTAAQSGTGQDTAMAPNAVVVSIEPMARESATMGSSSSGQAGGSRTATGSDQVHRVTVRMDDGSMVSIVQEAAPTFKSGDRVHVSNNMIQQ